MTDEQPAAIETQPATEEQPSRAAGVAVLAIAGAAAGGVVYAVPELGYFVAGLMATATVRKARGWAAGRRPVDEEQQPDEEPVDIVAVLYDLSAGGEHVRLTQLAEAAGLPDTKTVRALLEEAGIRVRAGVRTTGGNGPGVHMADIPALKAAPSGGCLCSSTANANTNNGGEEGPREGLLVQTTGQAGVTVYDLAEHRHYPVTKTR